MRLQHIVVTNDDGVDAPGLAVAEAIASMLAEQVWVVAPATDQSGTAQGLSMHDPIRIREQGERRYVVNGTPADCVMVALGTNIMAGQWPDMVISGVNWGHNLSDSVMYSGTVGAALAAAHFGCPAIALSQAFDQRSQSDFSAAKAWARPVIERLWEVREQHGCAWNINFPQAAADTIPGLRFTRQQGGSMHRPRLIEKTDARGLSYHWIAFERGLERILDPDSDVVAVRDHYISATPLKRERCDEQRLAEVGVGREWSLHADSDAGIQAGV